MQPTCGPSPHPPSPLHSFDHDCATGKCKYGGTCKFHHPLAGDNAAGGQGQQQQQQASQGGGYGFAAGGYGSNYGN